ncbi:MAG: ABC transporter ATP-binding protein [Bacteroidetes bacterium CG02_land_8_20_14_3_00_31_25]|nr:ATP-binding cassette domain-containing protein [Bacteroidota bacterium]PIV59052.1 MAG: ABC transporter ATP-binding protein [Bacteroidetes bacterium CG02_land_8_20_14_3_00_31_25]PIX36229.1 MAG: ABC transporter ATP-binding protein [Bacteroidetes bacterium CG_4_8_14_3_um_filter_31_14]PIY02272.1 MAG: ABC transporter ATP-binding protein [Bacteroidetes bacterium CG_4_10_14_3_um_filter_31_20]
MIEVKNISKQFEDGYKVLDNINIVFETGKTNLVIGQSGSGKTVLLKLIVGLYEVDEGSINFDGRNFSTMNFKERKLVRQEFGMLFQGGALFDSLTVIENVMFPLNLFSKLSLSEKLERANFCLKRVDLINKNHFYPSEISGGMKKRVAIARAIALNPKYLFCDEPNSGLDPVTSILIDNLIKEITEEYKITTIVNTHDMNSVMEIGDKVIYIYKGQKWWEGNKTQILNTDNKELNDFVFASELTKIIKSKIN